MEKQLFDLVHGVGETHNDRYSVYRVERRDDETRYRVDNLERGSFEVAEHQSSEEYNPQTDEWEEKNERWYSFNGKYHDDEPEMTIETAFEILK